MKVELTYFKYNGTYYASGIYNTEETDWTDIYFEVRRKHKNGKLPGLPEGSNGFIVLMDVPNHPDNIMKLISLPETNGVNVGGNFEGTAVVGNGNIVNKN